MTPPRAHSAFTRLSRLALLLIAGACVEGEGFTLGPQDAVIEVIVDGVPADPSISFDAYVYDPVSTNRLTQPVAMGGSTLFENLGHEFEIEVGITGLERHNCELEGDPSTIVVARSDIRKTVRFTVACRVSLLRVEIVGVDPIRTMTGRIELTDPAGSGITALTEFRPGMQELAVVPGTNLVTVDGFTDAQGLVWAQQQASVDVPVDGVADVTIAMRPDVLAVRIDPAVTKIRVGEVAHLEGYVTTQAAGEQQLQLTWNVSDVQMATLAASVSGQWADVTGVAPGEVEVTADFHGASASAIVNVLPNLVNAPPEPVITMPTNGSVLSGASPIAFAGSALDPEEGYLIGDALQWSSSMQGALGSGLQVAVQLVPGDHTITLTATDAAGASASTSIDIAVSDPNPSGSISGRVTANGYSMGDVPVTLSGPVSATVATDINGRYGFGALPAGTYTVSIESPFPNVVWPYTSRTVTLAQGQLLTIDFAGTY